MEKITDPWGKYILIVNQNHHRLLHYDRVHRGIDLAQFRNFYHLHPQDKHKNNRQQD